MRRLEPHPAGLVAIARDEGRHLVDARGVRLLQRGVRATVESETVKLTEKKFSLGRAALTGGLMTKKKVEREVQKESETREPFVLVQRDQGAASRRARVLAALLHR